MEIRGVIESVLPAGKLLISAACWIMLQVVPLTAERLPVKNLTVEDGLPANSINRIVPDSHGFFWICTGGGLARYDGYGFKNFTMADGLPTDRVYDIVETSSGEYWVATLGGLVRFTPTGTVHDRVITAEEAQSMDHVPAFVTHVPPGSKNVTRITFDHAGRAWVATGSGLFRFENGQFRKVDLPDQTGDTWIFGLFVAQDGAVWVGTYDYIYRVTDLGIASVHSPDMVFQSFAQDRNGVMWVGTTRIGVIQVTVDGGGRPVIARTFSELSQAGTWVNAVTPSSDGKMWLATDDGLIEFDPHADRPVFEIYTRNSGVGHTKYNAMVEDRAGNLWLGTRASGIYRIVRRGMISFGSEDGIEFVRAIFRCDGGQACFVGFLGSTALEGHGAKTDLKVAPSFYPYIWQLGRKKSDGIAWLRPNFARRVEYFGWGDRQNVFQAKNGEWWIGTGEGLFRFPAGTFETLANAEPLDVFDAKRGLAPVEVYRIFEDSSSDVWIATNATKAEGLFRWRRATGELEDLTPEMRKTVPAKSNFVSSIQEDRNGSMWLGYFDSGIGRYRNGRFEYFDETSGFPPSGTNDILADVSGKLWIASSRDGVVRVDDPQSDAPKFVVHNSRNGLSSNRTFALTTDWRNMIYVGTDRDVNRIDPVSEKIVQVPLGDGLPQQQIRSAYTDGNGTLWFGTTGGLLKYVPSPDTVPESLEVLLTNVRIEGVTHRISALGERAIDLGELASDKNQIEFEFTSLSAITNDRPRYQYKFTSSDTWSELEHRRTVSFAGLAAGDYSVEIRAVDSMGTVSRSPAVTSFRILRPFYQRWWFLALAVALIVALIYIVYRYRLERLLELEKVRTRIATDLHDDIGANLTRISVLSEVAKQRSTNGNGDLLESIAEIARESVASMSDIVWAIAPEHDSLLDLTRLMRRQAEEIFALRNVELTFNAPAGDLKLSVGARRDLLLIFKEAVNNAAKHSDCRRVEIDFSFRNSVLRLRVVDDGKGFRPDGRYEGHGLQSMLNRARQLGGDLKISSNGLTVVQLEVSLRDSLVSRL